MDFPGKWEDIFQSGKVGEFGTDWKRRGKSHKILEKYGHFRQMLLITFSDIYMNCIIQIKFSVKKNKTLKNSGKVREFCQSRKC